MKQKDVYIKRCPAVRSLAFWVFVSMCTHTLTRAQGIDLGSILGGGGGSGKACVFKCPKGVSPKARDGHKPTFNGCGVPGFMVQTKYGMTECCNMHDICYHTCKTGSERKKGQEICDSQFKKCMEDKCSGLKGQDREGCLGEANMMHGGVQMFGCGAYESSQAEACTCELDQNDRLAEKLSETERQSALLAFYSKHDASKTQAEVDKLLSKYKNAKKFVDLCRLLHDKYKEHPAEFAPPATKTGGDTKTDL